MSAGTSDMSPPQTAFSVGEARRRVALPPHIELEGILGYPLAFGVRVRGVLYAVSSASEGGESSSESVCPTFVSKPKMDFFAFCCRRMFKK